MQLPGQSTSHSQKSVSKKTVLLGASTNPQRYAYLAMESLKRHGHEVIGIGKEGAAKTDPAGNNELKNVDTVTLYLNPERQKEYYDYILALKPKRIIFNPGTENPELEKAARAKGIQALEACTLILLDAGEY